MFLSGPVGGTSAAAFALSKPSLHETLYEKSRHVLRRPRLPLEVAEKLRVLGIRLASIDLSDGLGIDAHRLANSSKVGLELWAEGIPLHPLVKEVSDSLAIDPLKFAFGFGGDGQFLFCADPIHEDAVLQTGSVKIGRILPSKEKTFLRKTEPFLLPDFGHEDFTGERSLTRLQHFIEEQDFIRFAKI